MQNVLKKKTKSDVNFVYKFIDFNNKVNYTYNSLTYISALLHLYSLNNNNYFHRSSNSTYLENIFSYIVKMKIYYIYKTYFQNDVTYDNTYQYLKNDKENYIEIITYCIIIITITQP